MVWTSQKPVQTRSDKSCGLEKKPITGLDMMLDVYNNVIISHSDDTLKSFSIPGIIYFYHDIFALGLSWKDCQKACL